MRSGSMDNGVMPGADSAPRTIAITGASGLVGSALCESLLRDGHRVRHLVRRTPEDDSEIFWDPASGKLDPDQLRGVDAVVHLAGENVGAKRWTDAQKARILDSRVQGTTTLCRAVARLDAPPRVLVSASAIGYYGSRGNEVIDEDAVSGEGFLTEVCLAWEGATEVLQGSPVRVAKLRTGLVMAQGGMLERILPVFRFGLGGKLGSGDQYMSWIALTDLVRLYRHLIFSSEINDSVNGVAPNPVTNAEFAHILARVLSRPAWFTVPKVALKIALGELSQEALGSLRIMPNRALSDGFEFQFPDLETALRHELGGT